MPGQLVPDSDSWSADDEIDVNVESTDTCVGTELSYVEPLQNPFEQISYISLQVLPYYQLTLSTVAHT